MKKNTIKETIEEINNFSKLLKEAYTFEDDEMGYDEQGAMNQEEQEMMMNHETDDIIDQIRQLALDGIQKYAEDVDNEMYITYKKIWMMCDKCLSEKDKVES